MRRWIVGAFLVVTLGYVGFAVAQSEQSKGAKPSTSASSKGQKLCSVVVPGQWRDTINMPAASTASSCSAFMSQAGANTYQLGCVFPDGSISLGQATGTPSPNCGW
jgi:hypothetical protein